MMAPGVMVLGLSPSLRPSRLGGCSSDHPEAPGTGLALRRGVFCSPPPRRAGKYTKLAVKIFTQQQFSEEFGMLI